MHEKRLVKEAFEIGFNFFAGISLDRLSITVIATGS